MLLREAKEILRKNGYEMNEASDAPKGNQMLRGGKPTNLFWAAVCVLNNDNLARSKDILADDVVSNWHALVPLMKKRSIETGENFFDSPEGPDPNGSYWSLTEFGYEQYKEASEYLGKKVLPFGKNTPKETMKEFTIKISMDDPNGTAEEDLNRQLDGLYDLGYETVNVEII